MCYFGNLFFGDILRIYPLDMSCTQTARWLNISKSHFQCIDGLCFGLLSTVVFVVGLSVVLNELKLCHLHHPF